MQVSARADYALRACVVLAAADDRPLSAEVVAMQADLPGKFVEAILTKLRQSRIVTTQRGPGGGCRLARSAEEISVADIIEAVDGPIGYVRGLDPALLEYTDHAPHLSTMWTEMRMMLVERLRDVTLQDLIDGPLLA
jgi:Rrf2 family protein